MKNSKRVFSVALCMSLLACGAPLPECADETVTALVLEGIKERSMDRLLSDKIASPGFRMVAALGQDSADTPAEVGAELASGQHRYSTWRKYTKTHEWIAVVVKQVETAWEAEQTQSGPGQLDGIQTLGRDENAGAVSCSAELAGAKEKTPIGYTVQRVDDRGGLSVDLQ